MERCDWSDVLGDELRMLADALVRCSILFRASGEGMSAEWADNWTDGTREADEDRFIPLPS